MNAATSDVPVPTSLNGLLKTIKKSKYILTPIYEAISNSLEAIHQQVNSQAVAPKIKVILNFSGLIEESKELENIVISDNGSGFTDESFGRFSKLLDDSKGYNNRGSGRIQILHRYERFEVESYFVRNGFNYKRNFSCDAKRFIYDLDEQSDVGNCLIGSVLTLKVKSEKPKENLYFDNLSILEFSNEIKNHFMLRMYLDSVKKYTVPEIEIEFTKNGITTDSYKITKSSVHSPFSKGVVEIPFQTFDTKGDKVEMVDVDDKKEILNWANFKISSSDLDKNGMFLCSKDIPVESLKFDFLNKTEVVDGYRYLTVFYGDLLDQPENVSHSVDRFTFPKSSDVVDDINAGNLLLEEGERYLFIDKIYNEIEQVESPQVH